MYYIFGFLFVQRVLYKHEKTGNAIAFPVFSCLGSGYVTATVFFRYENLENENSKNAGNSDDIRYSGSIKQKQSARNGNKPQGPVSMLFTKSTKAGGTTEDADEPGSDDLNNLDHASIKQKNLRTIT